MQLVNWDEEGGATMGVRIAIYTLTGSIVGAGAVSCPFAFQFMGSLGGLLLLGSMGFLSGYSGYAFLHTLSYDSASQVFVTLSLASVQVIC